MLFGSSVETTLSDNESIHENIGPHTILSRKNSYQSIGSTVEVLNHDSVQNDPIEISETCSSGDVSISVYSSYFSAGGNTKTLVLLLFLCIFTQVLASGGDYWISYWY